MGGGFVPVFDPRSWATRIAIFAAALFVFSLVAKQSQDLQRFLLHAFVLSPDRVVHHHEVWQLVTYGVFDAGGLRSSGAGDVLWSVLTLFFFWSFGVAVENQVGSRTFLSYVVGFALAGSLFATPIAMLVNQGNFAYDGLAVLFTAFTVVFARLNPDTPILFGFLLPIAGRWLVWLTFALLVLGALSVGSAVPYLPHFGAFGAAELAMRGINPRRWYLHFRAWQIERGLRKKASRFTVIPGEKGKDDKNDPNRNGWLH
jgi:membrane associated rhomboid family serine protease